MRAYFAHQSDIEELGEVSRDEVSSLIEKADASLSGDKQFGLGLYRSEQDFLEITPVGKSEYMLWSDILASAKRRGFMGLFVRGKPHLRKIVVGSESAVAAAHDYMDCSRDEFERKYR